MNWTNTELGNEYTGDGFLMFFGNRHGSIELIQKQYPNFDFRFLKQVHGTQCVESKAAELEADAHWTAEPNVALCIKTADCTPILIALENSVLAIHAGWRGVFHEILPHSLKTIGYPISVAMGPHIQKQSFQVSPDLGNEFSAKFGSQFVHDSHVNLNGILVQQLEQSSSEVLDLWCSDTDTLTEPTYFSHRAEPANMGRNISFVARL